MLCQRKEELTKATQESVSENENLSWHKDVPRNLKCSPSTTTKQTIDEDLDDSETHNTSQNSLNSSISLHSSQKYNNFDEIENFDLFIDLKPLGKSTPEESKSSSLIKEDIDLSSSQSSNKICEDKPSFNRSAYMSEGNDTLKLKRRLSLKDYEALYEKVKFVEINENKPGNYNKYVAKVFETLKDFDKIDFEPQIEEKAQYLGPNTQKYTLIIDLDETLIHTDFNNAFEREHDQVLHFTHENEIVDIPLILRPGLIDFLTFCQQYFEICIFTASRKEYADCILNFLDPGHQLFKYRFYREDCIAVKGKIFIKDLRIFKNRHPENIIIIDNSLYSFVNQLSNGILITSFYNNKNDKELINLKRYLKSIIDSGKDVRKINEKVFNFEQIRDQIVLDFV